MSHGTNILLNISLFKLSELSPTWVLNVTEILESLLDGPGEALNYVYFVVSKCQPGQSIYSR